MSEQQETNEGAVVKLSAVEGIKTASNGLYHPMDKEVGNASAKLGEECVQLLKHHGAYQQDNRDVRTDRKKAGLEWEYRIMVRTKFPGGRITAEQYLMCDDLASKYGQNDLRATSRQCFQFHGVVKRDLRPLLNDLNRLAKITTFGACGDVVRNTMACPVIDIDPRYAGIGVDLIALANEISAHFLPKSTSYYDLWVDDEKVIVHEDGTFEYKPRDEKPIEEPIYGSTYLPRKFKIGLGIDFDNSVDVYANDVGVLAVTENGKVAGFEVLVGGGLGYTHRKPETYARLATPLAFVSREELIPLIESIVKVQRDFGGRANRKHARMKYLIDDIGFDSFRAKVFEYAGRSYPAPRGIKPSAQPDYLGWHEQAQAGLNYVGVWIENGRIRDFEGSYRFRSGLREIVSRFQPDIRLTPHHNLVLANIRDEDVAAVQAILDQHGIPTDSGISQLRRLEMACPALPLCGLAMAESERAMPGLIGAIEANGHADADVIIRMSGCPNNCSRPRTAEIGIVGSGADRYILYTGGDYLGTRLNEQLAEKLTLVDAGNLVSALLSAWKANRDEGERFGDWSARVGVEGLRPYVETAAQAS
ncbi:MAG: NADPH-dependent assimilatory sulfite reductase hemoprotein subunit [Candidatus Hydrogenedentes bacterium]|nr:NADPH-dependent assimilatory sulfite reductase hemoprotein subunit [Candidatus Hydrogenedentota bacterium]